MPEEEEEEEEGCGCYFYQPPVSLPYQVLLEQLQACITQDERERLLMRFALEQLPKPLRAAVQAASVPRFFDRAFLNALLEQPLDEAQFAELTGLSYIEPYPGEGRFNVHERSRKLLQKKLWQEDEALYHQLAARALAWCVAQNWKDTTWRIERVYHALIADPEEGAYDLNDTHIEWRNPPNFAYDKAESLLRAVREHVEMKRLPKEAEYYFWLNQAVVDIDHSRFQEAKQALQQIPLTAVKDNRYLKGECLFTLGCAYLHLSELPEAQRCLEEVLPLYQEEGVWLNEANCLKALGDVHFRLSEFDNSRMRYEEALPLYQDTGLRLSEANCLMALGDLHLHLSEFQKARLHYEEAIQLYRDIKDRDSEEEHLDSFVDLVIETGDWADAWQNYEHSVVMSEPIQYREGIAECWEGFAKLHQAQQQFPQAEEYWHKAADMYRQLSMPLREQHCLEQLRQMKEQKQLADERDESSTNNG